MFEKFMKKKRKEGEALFEKDFQEYDFHTFHNDFFVSSEWLDTEKAIAWGSYMGILLGDFEAIICKYCNERKRKYFFAYNNFGQPTCFFDVETKEELFAQWEKEREEEIKKLGIKKGSRQTRKFVSPKKKVTQH